MRIIAGKWAGRRLTSPGDRSRIRPTSETVREAWMELLGPHLRDARIVDLFAGTGAVGLEALSRGAASADFVESQPASLHALKANIAALRARDRCRVFVRDALPWAAALESERYDLAFADPPYGSRMLDRLIETWQRTRFARILSVEHAADHALPPGGARHLFADSAVTVYT